MSALSVRFVPHLTYTCHPVKSRQRGLVLSLRRMRTLSCLVNSPKYLRPGWSPPPLSLLLFFWRINESKAPYCVVSETVPFNAVIYVLILPRITRRKRERGLCKCVCVLAEGKKLGFCLVWLPFPEFQLAKDAVYCDTISQMLLVVSFAELHN